MGAVLGPGSRRQGLMSSGGQKAEGGREGTGGGEREDVRGSWA